MSSKTSTFLLSALAVVASSFAMADTAVTVKSEVVKYDDIRLISNVGAAVLYGRLRSAAERACGGPIDRQQMAIEARYRACVDDAVAKAVADVNQPLLTIYYENKRKGPAQKSAANVPSNAATVAKAP